MPKSTKKRDNTTARETTGGSTFIGFLLGLVLGLMIALGVAWYINKLPNPFKEKSAPPKVSGPNYPPPGPKVTAPENTKPTAPEVAAKSDKGEKVEKAATDTKSTPASGETFYLQTGSFQNASEADSLKARLALLGLEATVQQRTLPEKGVWHRVRVGPYSDMDELNRVRGILQQNDIETALVKVRSGE